MKPGIQKISLGTRIGSYYEHALEILLIVLITPALLSSISALEWTLL
jgi:hypothetical protein